MVTFTQLWQPQLWLDQLLHKQDVLYLICEVEANLSHLRGYCCKKELFIRSLWVSRVYLITKQTFVAENNMQKINRAD